MPNKNNQTIKKYLDKGHDIVKKGIEAAKPVIKEAGKEGLKVAGKIIVDKIMKGIFNDADFYNAYLTPVLAMNESRPINAETMKDITPLITGAATGYVIDTNVELLDQSKSEALDFACAQTMQHIRASLKSNLRYDVSFIKAFILASSSANIILRHIERSMKWYEYFDARRPEVNSALKVYVTSDSIGLADPKPIANVYDDSDYAYAKTRIELVSSMINHLIVPSRLGRFIDHYFGTVFTDGDMLHQQFYRLNCTKLPMYYIDKELDGQIEVTYVNPMDVTVDQFIEYLNDIFAKFSVVMADLEKIDVFSRVTGVKWDSPIAKMDISFFNILVNSYTSLPKLDPEYEGDLSGFFGVKYKDIIRVDFFQSLPDASKIDVALGLGAILPSLTIDSDPNSDTKPFMHVINQGLIFSAGVNNTLTGGGFVASVPEGSYLDIDAETISTAGFKTFAITTDFMNNTVITVSSPSSGGSNFFTQTVEIKNPVTSSQAGFIDLALLNLTGDNTFSVRYGSRALELYDIVSNSTSQGYTGTSVYLELYPDTNEAHLMVCPVTVSSKGRVSGTAVRVGNISYTIIESGSYYGYTTYVLSDQIGSYSTTDWDDIFVKAFTGRASVIMQNTMTSIALKASIRLDEAEQGDGIVTMINSISAAMLPWFIETVDYHIPVIYGRLFTISAHDNEEGVDTAVVRVPEIQFLKETYNPVVLSLDDVKYTLYNMMMSLYAINNPKGQVRDRYSTNKNSRR